MERKALKELSNPKPMKLIDRMATAWARDRAWPANTWESHPIYQEAGLTALFHAEHPQIAKDHQRPAYAGYSLWLRRKKRSEITGIPGSEAFDLLTIGGYAGRKENVAAIRLLLDITENHLRTQQVTEISTLCLARLAPIAMARFGYQPAAGVMTREEERYIQQKPMLMCVRLRKAI